MSKLKLNIFKRNFFFHRNKLLSLSNCIILSIFIFSCQKKNEEKVSLDINTSNTMNDIYNNIVANDIFYLPFKDDDVNAYGFWQAKGTYVDPKNRTKQLSFQEVYKNKVIWIKPEYEDALNFSEGLAAVKKKGKWGVIDTNNEWVIYPTFEQIGRGALMGEGYAFQETLAPAKKEGKWGYIDVNGAWIIPPTFNDASCFSEGIASVKCKGESVWSFIDKKGNILYKGNYDVTLPFFEGLAAVLPSNSAWCYVDKKGNKIVDYKRLNPFKNNGFDAAFSFSDEMALVKPDNKYFGYVNKQGELAIKDIYIEALGFSYGFAGVRVENNEKWGFIDKNGTWKIEPKYDTVTSFLKYSDGSIKATVKENGKTKFIEL